jgi:hypothetical protein
MWYKVMKDNVGVCKPVKMGSEINFGRKYLCALKSGWNYN